ncbi:MAG TPA: LytTR family DNA-binding domain-containing protein [Hanamia sp.]
MISENAKKKTRLIVKNDKENIVLSLIDIALLYIEEGMVLVTDRFSRKYYFNASLSEVEKDLDESVFFRANRQVIVNINFIKGFTVLECNKIKVALTLTCNEPPIIISQQTAPLFKKWLCES